MRASGATRQWQCRGRAIHVMVAPSATVVHDSVVDDIPSRLSESRHPLTDGERRHRGSHESVPRPGGRRERSRLSGRHVWNRRVPVFGGRRIRGRNQRRPSCGRDGLRPRRLARGSARVANASGQAVEPVGCPSTILRRPRPPHKGETKPDCRDQPRNVNARPKPPSAPEWLAARAAGGRTWSR